MVINLNLSLNVIFVDIHKDKDLYNDSSHNAHTIKNFTLNTPRHLLQIVFIVPEIFSLEDSGDIFITKTVTTVQNEPVSFRQFL